MAKKQTKTLSQLIKETETPEELASLMSQAAEADVEVEEPFVIESLAEYERLSQEFEEGLAELTTSNQILEFMAINEELIDALGEYSAEIVGGEARYEVEEVEEEVEEVEAEAEESGGDDDE